VRAYRNVYTRAQRAAIVNGDVYGHAEEKRGKVEWKLERERERGRERERERERGREREGERRNQGGDEGSKMRRDRGDLEHSACNYTGR